MTRMRRGMALVAMHEEVEYDCPIVPYLAMRMNKCYEYNTMRCNVGVGRYITTVQAIRRRWVEPRC